MSEPVTWATEDLKDVMSPKFKEMRMDTNSSTYRQFPVPLYTHPMCELTDKEIEKVGRENLSYWDSYDEGLMLFARAIIKASRGEK